MKFAHTLASDGKFTHIGGELVPSDYREPDINAFDKKSKHIHEWINYLSDAMRELWGTFTDEQKAAIAAQAQSIADREHWD